MKTILCYGDSNTYGYIPETGMRYPREIRYPGRLQMLLGNEYTVIEEGCNGRTTIHDDPIDGWKKSLGSLQYIEQRNTPDNCKYCGKHLVRKPHSGKKLFCSDECRRRWWKEHPEAGNKSAGAYYNQVCTYCGRFFSSYGKKGRKYCCHDCYIMDRFWSDGDKDRVVAKNPDRKTIKIAL